jgi:hypothetical protein
MVSVYLRIRDGVLRHNTTVVFNLDIEAGVGRNSPPELENFREAIRS